MSIFERSVLACFSAWIKSFCKFLAPSTELAQVSMSSTEKSLFCELSFRRIAFKICALDERANGVVGTACDTVGDACHSVGIDWLLPVEALKYTMIVFICFAHFHLPIRLCNVD